MKYNAVTYSKAIAIMLMVLAHSGIPSPFLDKWINMFHMPLFFIMSGYCFKDTYLDNCLGFVRRKIEGIYWPFVKWAVLFILLHNVFCHFNIYSPDSTYGGVECDMLYSFKEILTKAKDSILYFYTEQLLGGYWFLKELFLGNILFYLFVLLTRRKWFLGVGLLLVNILFLWFNFHRFNISGITILATVFIWIGYMIKKMNFVAYKKTWFPLLGFTIVSLCSVYLPASCLTVNAITYIPFVVSAVFGSMSVLSLCEVLDRMDKGGYPYKFLRFIGENTLTILTWHFLSFKLVSFAIVQIWNLPMRQLGYFPIIGEYASNGWYIAYFFVGLLVPLGLASLNKFIPSKWWRL